MSTLLQIVRPRRRAPWTGSAWQRVGRCPGSLHLPQVDSDSAMAKTGRALHDYLERVGAVGPDRALTWVPEEHRKLCEAVDVDELPTGAGVEVAFAVHIETGAARELGRRLRRDYSGATDEEIPLTADVAGILRPGVAYACEYKLGDQDLPPCAEFAQTRLEGLAAARAYGCDKAVVDLVKVIPGRRPLRDRAVFDAFDLDVIAWELRRDAERAQTSDELAEGPWCNYCPAWAHCPAKARLLASMSGKPLEFADDLSVAVTPEMAARAWELCGRIEAATARVRDRVREYAVAAGGLPLNSGKTLVQVTRPGKTRIDAEIAREVIRDFYGPAVARAAAPPHATQDGIRQALCEVSDGDSLAGRVRRVMGEIRARGGATNDDRTAVKEV